MSSLAKRLARRWAIKHGKTPPAAVRGGRQPRGPKTHCKHGHELTEKNLRVGRQLKNGVYYVKRECKACARKRERERYYKSKEAV